ncbi:hypothetical protein RRG08_022841 [Elysia crispata]|uniref:Uncharacterized protein n=1 Tax=Elysia crispata TaxID=231223 RepID=A0AAE0Z298_9GAST|nr:hypothetical protein RRG08_022841 [Elysia crispata]
MNGGGGRRLVGPANHEPISALPRSPPVANRLLPKESINVLNGLKDFLPERLSWFNKSVKIKIKRRDQRKLGRIGLILRVVHCQSTSDYIYAL